jgi:uncharacterized membrane protein YoaK (UPF0700 family)
MRRIAAIALLAWSAGFVDALGYVTLGGVFTSHLTGNTCAVAVALVTGRETGAARRATMMAGFGVGGILGTIVLDRARGGASAALTVVAALLAVSSFGLHQLATGAGSLLTEILIACLAAAMGVQNVALAHGNRRGHTTHITGPYTDFIADVTSRITRVPRAEDRIPLPVHAGRLGGFAVGAMFGAAAAPPLGAFAPLVAGMGVLAAAVLLAPISNVAPS